LLNGLLSSNIRKRRRTHKPKLSTNAWLIPGSLTVDPESPFPAIYITAFNANESTESSIKDPQEIKRYIDEWPVVWVNVDGLGDADVIAAIGEIFGLHRLSLEDVLHVHQRAKVEHFGSNTFIVTRLASVINQKLETEQLSLFLGQNFVLTFQEDATYSLVSIRERIKSGRGKIRASGADYLAYCIIDNVIDSYFPVLEYYGEQLDALEDLIIARANNDPIPAIHSVKRDLLALRRAIWPQRDAISALIRDEIPLFTGDTRVYLRDCYDHVARIIDLVEMYRELGADLMDLCLSTTSQKLNEIMSVLTIISTIFIPLTFIAGVYGMNFDSATSPWNMPELRWRYGYPFSIILMLATTLVMIWFFKKKGWLSQIHTNQSNIGKHSKRDE
jgi:magnesium transporter